MKKIIISALFIAGVYYAAKEGLDLDCSSNESYTKINYDNERLQEKEDRFEDGFLESLEEMCGRLDMHCMGLLSVMDFETGGTFSPGIRNPRSTATGLIQFLERTANGLGTSTRDLANMTQTEQLEFVKRYFQNQQRYHPDLDYSDPAQIALTVFYPARASNPEQAIFGRGSSGYRSNRELDKNRDGRITGIEYSERALNRGYLE